MKNLRNLLILLVVSCLFLSACGTGNAPTEPQGTTVPATEQMELVDYADELKLNMSSPTVKTEATVRNFVDGDTVHFYVSSDTFHGRVLEARFLAINTPESTGKIEEYGKAASLFTKEKLSNATSIILESESETWNVDSTGGRYLVWVWYKTDADSDYRNLNVEILQNGLSRANSSGGNQYGSVCTNAINQAQKAKLNLYSGEKDPLFYYGEAISLSLRELRTNIEDYSNMKVAFDGLVTINSGSQGVYVEDYDDETGMNYGIFIYYGHNLSGGGLDILSIGNRVRVVGTVQYYQAGGTWQIAGVEYRMMRPDDPDNLKKFSEGNPVTYHLTDADTFVNGVVSVEREEGTVDLPYCEMALGTAIEMKGLKVLEITSTESAMDMTCECDGQTVYVRAGVFKDEAGQPIPEDAYLGKTIDVKGAIDAFDGQYQIKVFNAKNITIIE